MQHLQKNGERVSEFRKQSANLLTSGKKLVKSEYWVSPFLINGPSGEVEIDDLIIMGTDGVFDNLFLEEIVDLVRSLHFSLKPRRR